ncbi:MAG: DUF1669 domain-containing protein [Candidatus Brocadiaceae bacterium]|nr:DUF1669 domain-containing protein [Candidatus Brocadiaceae bacterium]
MQILRSIRKIGLFKILFLLGFSITTVISTSSLLYAKTEILFSPGGSIRAAIVKTIINSSNSIDIAAFTFTAGEIAEALHKAKERGVKIRVIIDYKQDENHYPVIEFLKEEGFNLQFLKGNIGGSMNNTFAIFDGKLIVTGSYNWTEYSEKFNYENALFIDETNVIEKYKKEFALLYDKSIVQGAGRLEKLASAVTETKKEAVPNSGKEDSLSKIGNIDKVDSKRETSEGREGNTVTLVAGRGDEPIKTHEEGKQVSVNTIQDQHEPFVDISFIEFDKIFNNESTLEKSEKTRLWKEKFEGKYVRWTGTIRFKGIAVYDWNKVGISHKGGDVDVNLKFDYSKQRKVLKLKVGDKVTYTGKLISLSSMFASYRLEDVDVIQVRRLMN